MKRPLDPITMIIPYYRNPGMLREQVRNWNEYALLPQYRFIVVDDGSPEPALDVIKEAATGGVLRRLRLYRVLKDIAWNRGGARNLGAREANTRWIIHLDIDHILPFPSARALGAAELPETAWYRFPRWRRGRADATRRKDSISPEETFGAIHPHVDSYLCTLSQYWAAGGYDEDYSGCLGGGNPFLAALSAIAPVKVLPEEIPLYVYTRDVIPDASDHALSRDPSEYIRRRKDKAARGDIVPRNPIRFEWERQL